MCGIESAKVLVFAIDFDTGSVLLSCLFPTVSVAYLIMRVLLIGDDTDI